MCNWPPDSPSLGQREMTKKLGKAICDLLDLDPKDVYELHLNITVSAYSGFALLYDRRGGHYYLAEDGKVATVKIGLPFIDR